MAPLRLLLTSLLALGAVALPTAKVSVRSSDTDSYLPTTWSVQAFLDGPLLELNGTATEIHSQLLELNPNFDTDFPSFQAEINAMLSPYLVKQRAHKRDDKTTELPARDLPTTWSVQAFPDGPLLQLNGTIEEVHTQLVSLNPNFDTDFPSFEAEVNAMKWLEQMSAADSTASKRSIPLDSEWTVQAFPNGPFLNMTGPIDKVHVQLLKINPDFDVDFPSFVADHRQYQDMPDDSQDQDKNQDQDQDNELDQQQSILSTRSTSSSFANIQPECNTQRLTFISYVQTGLEYLNKLKSPAPQNAAHSCGRISCCYDASIYWCNNSDKPLTLDSWSDIADATQRIVDKCTSNNVPFGYLSGNISHPNDQWSVLVKYEKC